MELAIVHNKAAAVVVFPASRQVMVDCATSGDNYVDEFAFDEFAEYAAGARGDQVACKREELDAAFCLYHVFHDADTGCKFARSEAPGAFHLFNELIYGHFF